MKDYLNKTGFNTINNNSNIWGQKQSRSELKGKKAIGLHINQDIMDLSFHNENRKGGIKVQPEQHLDHLEI